MSIEFTGAIVLTLLGTVIGAISAWYLLRNRISAARDEGRSEGNTELARANERALLLGTDLDRERARTGQQENQILDIQNRLNEITAESARLSERAERVSSLEEQVNSIQAAKESLAADVSRLTAILDGEREQNPEKLALLNEAKEKLSDAFKTVANDILEDKARRFTEQNKSNISDILQPLNVKIQEFKDKVEQVYVQDTKDRTELRTQVTHLMSLSARVADDAKNLTDALKGSSKIQGNWGELLLESVLEESGLRKGHEYELRGTFHYDDGTRAQPDVVIKLPEDRDLVIDAKVSLTDYERYASADTDQERKAALESHVASVRKHIRELSQKDYHTLYELKSLDLVVMFVPLEPAFAAAIGADSSLWEEGLKRNVLLVSPSSLLFVLRTVAYLWRQEAQARHVQDIAKCGADLYDKFVGFVADVQDLGHQLEKAQGSFDDASNKLCTGKGNLVSRADKLRKLGVMPKKLLPIELVDVALEESVNVGAPTTDSELVETEETKTPVVP
jgi:DNA recombination protein RmuC